MSVRFFSTSSIKSGVKGSDFWDGSTTLGSFESISTYTVSGSPVSSITFSSIPQTYKHLQMRFLVKNTLGNNDYSNVLMTINGSSGNYRYYRIGNFYNSGGTQNNTANVNTYTYALANAAMPCSGGNLTNIFGTGVLEFPNYSASSTYKSMMGAFGFSSNSNPDINFFGGSTTPFSDAISSIVLIGDSDQFAVGSTISLYGLKE